jgi:hypothetical protein
MEEELAGGSVTRVTKLGDVVYREGGPWVEAVHSVLKHLEVKGVKCAPKALGVADDGREMISFLPGSSMYRPWREVMFTDSALEQAAKMLRTIHDASEDLELPKTTIWRNTTAPKKKGQIIRHGDLGPWNTLWEGDILSGLIDWDFCEPGERLTDIAQLAAYFVPFIGGGHWKEAGFGSEPDYSARLNVICRSYGDVSAGEVVRALKDLHALEKRRIIENAELGIYPWTKWREAGEAEKIDEEASWLKHHFPGSYS